MRSLGVRGFAATVAIGAWLLIPASASAAVSQVFDGLLSPPVACTLQSGGPHDGQRWCDATPSRVRSFDGTPIDVSVTLPPAPATGPDGNYPLVGIYHGWGGDKIVPGAGATQRWVNQGYAVFSMTDRGWHESCGSDASRAGLPPYFTCANGDIRLMDFRYEVRDAQYLMGLLVDQHLVDPQRIAATGGSYGGMASAALGTLKDRVMLGDGSLVPWTSPGGTPMRVAAATPSALGTDVIYTQVPNGSTLDYAAQNPYFGPNGDKRVGVQKFTVMNAFYTGALNSPQGTAGADLIALGSAANAPGPYDYLKPALIEALKTHGALNVPDGDAPAPMLLSDGFSDDFVGADESIKLYNRIHADDPSTPVAMYFADQGHARSNDKAADAQQLNALQDAWINYYVKGEGSPPPQDVQLRGITCPASAPSSGPYEFPNWAAVSSGELRLTSGDPKTIASSGTLNGTAFTNPTGDACSTAPAADNPATANYRMPATATGFDVAGSPTILMRLDVSGASDQLAARLTDVAPDGTEALVDRGLLRPQMKAPGTVQTLQLHPNVWHVAAGHLLKLELMPDEYPYSRRNPTATDAESQHPIKVLALQLRVPTMQGPGGSGGQIQAPLDRYLPPGYTPAFDFAGKTTTVAPNLPSSADGGTPVRKCAGQKATIAGTSKHEVIKGTRGHDVIVAFGGGDKILGNAGNDLICAGGDNDLVLAGKGNDRVYGQAGNDVLKGVDGKDTLNGAAGNDRLWGGRGNDILKGGPGKDVLRGGRGKDIQRP